MNLVKRLPVPNHSSFSLVGDPKALQPIQGDPILLQLLCYRLVLYGHYNQSGNYQHLCRSKK